MNWLEQHLGEALVATGVIHVLYSAAEHRSVLAHVWRAGLVNSVPARGERNEALWFTTGGGLMIGAGLLARSHLRRTGTLPPAFGATLLATALANGVLQPASGIWAVAAESIVALRLTTRRPTAAGAAPAV
jgi:hypothetical protein